jgi:hypothetical protein
MDEGASMAAAAAKRERQLQTDDGVDISGNEGKRIGEKAEPGTHVNTP